MKQISHCTKCDWQGRTIDAPYDKEAFKAQIKRRICPKCGSNIWKGKR